MQKYNTVAMKDVTYDRLTEICRKVGKAKTQLLSEIVDEIYILTANVDGFNVAYSTDLIGNTLHIILTDRKFQAQESKMDAKTLKAESQVVPLVVHVKPQKKVK